MLPLPKEADVFTFPYVREVVTTNYEVELSAQDLSAKLSPALPALIKEWNKRVVDRLKNLARDFYSLADDVEPTQSAAAYFYCGACETLLHISSVVQGHDCFYRRKSPPPKESTVYDAATRLYGSVAWDEGFLKKSLLMFSLVETLGYDPRSATLAQLETSTGLVTCNYCRTTRTTQAMDYEDAVCSPMTVMVLL